MRRSKSEVSVSVADSIVRLTEHVGLLQDQLEHMREEMEEMRNQHAYAAAFAVLACVGLVAALSSSSAH